MSYEEQLQQEAALWGAVDAQHAAQVPPDWNAHRHLRHNAIMHTADIDALLAHIQPEMRALELGCASGWLSLAMAQRGAHVTGLDISDQSLQIARDYYAQVQAQTRGSVEYAVADLNALSLPANTYDVIVTKGTLHHLVGMEHVIATVFDALKPGGLFWVSDQDGDEALPTALFASAVMFVLPTTVSYRAKFGGLFKFGLNAPARIKASMQAEGLSPFEGAGREHDWRKLIYARFDVAQEIRKPAITGYIAHQIDLPDAAAMPILKALRAVDGALVRMGALKSTGVILYARKPAAR